MPKLGWIPFRYRSPAQHKAHARALAQMPPFYISGAFDHTVKKVCLYDCWSNPLVVRSIGFVFPRFHQLTGSCVGAGGGNALFSLIATQVVLQNKPEMAVIPFWPLDYGISRKDEGDHGEGEGSTGSAFAQAVRETGVIPANLPGLPQFQNQDGLVLTEPIEMQWSDGDRIPDKWLEQARTHLVKTTAQLQGVNDVRAAILNGYPVTCACDDYIGNATIEGSGEDACVVGTFDGQGGHQTSIHAFWDHPTLGPLYWYQNNWPASTYPKDPAGGPPCGCWIKEATLNLVWSRLDGEVYAFSSFDGFPAQQLNWLI